MSLLQLHNVCKSFGPTQIIRDVSLNIEQGEKHAIIGPNGAGKSTLFHLISGRYKVSSGEILFKGRNLLALSEEEMRKVRGREIGMIFQEPMTSLNPVLTVGRQLTEPLEIHLGMTRAQAEARVRRTRA